MTPQDVITEARHILQDTDSVGAGYRQANTELLLYVNGGVRECAIAQPALFSTVGDMTCVAGQCEQSISFSDAFALLEVLCIHDGAALTPFDLMAMGAFNPSWRSDTAAAARQWARFANDPLRFFIYPKAPASQVLDVRYVRLPTTYTIDQTITDLPSALQPALADYVVYRAESKDSEHAVSQRATEFYKSFLAKVKG